ncbi:hypothetical protein [Vibrio gallaecicus]|nr:hypothetical protein [Vibrio gallaecicus]MDN3616010.1 hypothetical protein [Vibrio gallaecicus]
MTNLDLVWFPDTKKPEHESDLRLLFYSLEYLNILEDKLASEWNHST